MKRKHASRVIEEARAAVRSLQPEIIETVRFLSVTDRGSRNLEGLSKTAAFLSRKLAALGCEVTVHPDPEYGATLVGRKSGRGEVSILLFAHYDTIWPVGANKDNPFRIEGDFAYGPGIADCTNGIIGALYSLEALNVLGVDNFREIVLLFNPDEEITSPSSTRWIQHYAQFADVAFCMEGPDNVDEYVSSRSGSAYFDIRVRGRMAHAGAAPEQGRDAIQELVFKLHYIQQRPIDDTYLVIVEIGGGSGDCVVPDNAHALIRYRANSHRAIAAVRNFMDEVATRSFIEDTRTTIEYLPGAGFGPLEKQPWTDKFCALVDEVSAEMGMPLHEVHCGGGDDAVSASLLTPTLDGLTPVGYGCHSHSERLDLTTVEPRIALMAVLLQRIGSDPRYIRATENAVRRVDESRLTAHATS